MVKNTTKGGRGGNFEIEKLLCSAEKSVADSVGEDHFGGLRNSLWTLSNGLKALRNQFLALRNTFRALRNTFQLER